MLASAGPPLFQIFTYEMFNKKQEGFESHWIFEFAAEDISEVQNSDKEDDEVLIAEVLICAKCKSVTFNLWQRV